MTDHEYALFTRMVEALEALVTGLCGDAQTPGSLHELQQVIAMSADRLCDAIDTVTAVIEQKQETL